MMTKTMIIVGVSPRKLEQNGRYGETEIQRENGRKKDDTNNRVVNSRAREEKEKEHTQCEFRGEGERKRGALNVCVCVYVRERERETVQTQGV